MNSCFKYFFIFLFLVSFKAYDMNIYGLYTASCNRNIGVILEADMHFVKLLSLKGEIFSIPRYEIIYMVEYPLDSVPFRKVSDPIGTNIIEIRTKQDREIVPLATGWPVDYSEEDISLLSLKGEEVIIGRDRIWSVEFKPAEKNITLNDDPLVSFEFINPYAFQSCPTEIFNPLEGEPRKIYPQQFYNDAVSIKKELDRRMAGYDKIKVYARSQQFYAQPFIYQSKTALGLWLSTGARYGASGTRSNNLNPLLTNEFATGPFGYQHIFNSGNGPLSFTTHSEIQSQLYYRFKADYFHLSVFLDPNLFLVGDKYLWRSEDISSVDDRTNDYWILETGIDYGPISLEWFPIVALNSSVRFNDKFAKIAASQMRFGLLYQHHLFKTELIFGHTFGFNTPDISSETPGKSSTNSNQTEEKAPQIINEPGSENLSPELPVENMVDTVELPKTHKLNLLRWNFDLLFYERMIFQNSIIYNTTLFKGEFDYESYNLSETLLIFYQVTQKYSMGALIGIEFLHSKSSTTSKDTVTKNKFFPKIGLSASHWF